MNYTISIDYKGSTICLKLNLPPSVSLVINNIVRDQQSAASGSDVGFYLSTTVQVGYEEHELIEGRVSYHADIIRTSLTANGVELLNETINT